MVQRYSLSPTVNVAEQFLIAITLPALPKKRQFHPQYRCYRSAGDLQWLFIDCSLI